MMRRIRILLLSLMLALPMVVSGAVMGDGSIEGAGAGQAVAGQSAAGQVAATGARGAASNLSFEHPAPIQFPLSGSEDALPEGLRRWIRWAEARWAVLTRWLERLGLWPI